MNTANSQTYIHIPGRDQVNSLNESFFRLSFDVCDSATKNRYADGDNIRLVNSGPIALFSVYKLFTSSGKDLEEITHGHIASLL